MKLATILGVVFSVCGLAQAVEPGDLKIQIDRAIRDVKPVSAVAVDRLKGLAIEDFRLAGFASKEEVAAATAGDALGIFVVRLDELKNFAPGTDPHKLLHPVSRVMVPVTVNGQVRSSVEMEKDAAGRWEAVSFGRPATAQIYSRVRTARALKARVQPADCFVVQIPALNLRFLGHHDARRTLVLVPFLDEAPYGLKAETAYDAAVVFGALKRHAQAHDGSPR